MTQDQNRDDETPMKPTLLVHDNLTVIVETRTNRPVMAEILGRLEAAVLDLRDCAPGFRAMLVRLEETNDQAATRAAHNTRGAARG